MSSFKFTNINEVLKRIQKQANKQIVPVIISKAIEIAEPLIKNEVIGAFERTKVYRGLNDSLSHGNDQDLLANLGLGTYEAQSAITDIGLAIRAGIDIVGFRGRSPKGFSNIESAKTNAIGFTINATKLAQSLLELPIGSYISKNGHQIPWMSWLLNGGSTYAIIFYDHEVPFNITNFSKSGRAIMARPEESESWRADNKTIWDIDDASRRRYAESPGGNFIFDIIEDTELQENGRNIIVDSVSKAVNTVNKRNSKFE